MICFPNAKINLGLNIISKRSDGYHNIETVFYPINLCDALEIVPAKEEQGIFKQTGISVDGDPQSNLVMQACRTIQQIAKLPEIDIYLRKNIPFGAGLGGGSSDAAFMLKLLNNFAELNLSNEQLEEIAAQIGADCPFFIQNQPVFAKGIGNLFTPIDFSLAGYYLTLVKPDIHVSTKDAYANVKPELPVESIASIIQQPVSAWKDKLINDFEKSVFPLFPAIGEIKQKLYDNGALYASMTGSGSSVFGIFEEEKELKDLFPDSLVYCIMLL
jgi:4-diphosphocytidyl-2C-methyl-D-erythritol kinase